MRQITDHHDGHGLAESITITADEPDQNGASHYYEISIDGRVVGRVQFQKGPRKVDDSTPGALDSVLLAIVVDRMRGFNAGPYSSAENTLVMRKAQEAMHWLKHRADERAQRGVLGKNAK